MECKRRLNPAQLAKEGQLLSFYSTATPQLYSHSYTFLLVLCDSYSIVVTLVVGKSKSINHLFLLSCYASTGSILLSNNTTLSLACD